VVTSDKNVVDGQSYYFYFFQKDPNRVPSVMSWRRIYYLDLNINILFKLEIPNSNGMFVLIITYKLEIIHYTINNINIMLLNF